MKESVVEWLEEQTRKPEWHSLKRQDIFEQAKEMERQQIIDARVTSPLLDTCNKNDYVIEAEQYYNETFKSE